MELYFDGAAKNNGSEKSEAGCGWVIDPGDIRGCKYLGKATNNEAEYQGMIEGLKQLNPDVQVKVYGDSKLVIEQMKGNWKVKAANLKPLWEEANRITKSFKNIEYIWIRRELNGRADSMANESIVN